MYQTTIMMAHSAQCASTSPRLLGHVTTQFQVYRSPIQQTRQFKTLSARQEVQWVTGLLELFGHTGDDPGHWNFSPEWIGTQGGAWGRDAGVTVFEKRSDFNGLVTVTAHAVGSENPTNTNIKEEWRVLRFNHITRQSVSRVSLGANGAAAQPDCLAQEYLKTYLSVAAALVGARHSKVKTNSRNATVSVQNSHLRVLCIGIGGGSLPLFLSRHFPNTIIDAVELDPVVVEASRAAMGFPTFTELPQVQMHIQDAAEFVAKYVEQGSEQRMPGYDFVFIDAFDGQDNVPAALCSESFAALLAAALHPDHGTLLINLHSMGEDNIRSITRRFGKALAGDDGIPAITSFSVMCTKQPNYTAVCARGLDLGGDGERAKEQLKVWAGEVAGAAGYKFSAAGRAVDGLNWIT